MHAVARAAAADDGEADAGVVLANELHGVEVVEFLERARVAECVRFFDERGAVAAVDAADEDTVVDCGLGEVAYGHAARDLEEVEVPGEQVDVLGCKGGCDAVVEVVGAVEFDAEHEVGVPLADLLGEFFDDADTVLWGAAPLVGAPVVMRGEEFGECGEVGAVDLDSVGAGLGGEVCAVEELLDNFVDIGVSQLLLVLIECRHGLWLEAPVELWVCESGAVHELEDHG